MNERAMQLQYELEADAAAVADRLNQLRTESLGGDVDLPRARKLQVAAFGIVQRSIEAEQQGYARGAGAKYKEWLRRVPSDVAAVIALRTCLELCSRADRRPVLLQSLATEIGRLYELEVRIENGNRVNPVYMRKIANQIDQRGTVARRHIRGVYSKALETVLQDADSELTQSERLQLGKFGVAAVLETGLIQQTRAQTRQGTMVGHSLTQEAFEFLTAYDESDTYGVMDVMNMAMQCPPDPWTSLREGGYLSERRRRVCPLQSLHKVRPDARKATREAFTPEKMPKVFETANYLQSIAWSLHQPTVQAIQRIWSTGGGVMGVPRREAPVVPPCPFPPEWEKAEATEAELGVFKAWKAEARRSYEKAATWRGHVREVGGFLKATSRGLERFWLPVFVDGRGRWYYRGSPNPQGSDMAKAAMHFADKKPLGKDGLFWLKVHIANSLGYDKERLHKRAAYTDEVWPALEAALDAPDEAADVWGTDAPWCAYAAAWELREALRSGDPHAYETGIPIHMDATCSGLQHFSAMLRDEVGGRYVNLFDSGGEVKEDIYARVAALALESIERDLESSDAEERAMAAWWLAAGIPRGLAKKPVMTFVYGATLLGTAEFVEDYVAAEMPESKFPPLAGLTYSLYAARKLFLGISNTVPSAESAMRWLRNSVRTIPKGSRVTWTTPTGFLVNKDYLVVKVTRVKVASCGISMCTMLEPTNENHTQRTQNAVAPNFVHSLDATHLAMTSARMAAAGKAFVGIHDSFGTHPSDVAFMQQQLREAFIELYSNPNLLAGFLWDIKGLGSAPPRGTLDLEQVRTSEFFFC